MILIIKIDYIQPTSEKDEEIKDLIEKEIKHLQYERNNLDRDEYPGIECQIMRIA